VKYTTLPPKKRKARLCPARHRTAELVIANYLNESGVKFAEVTGNKAFYAPMLDTVNVPRIEQFKEQSEFYATVFHELGHSTGHVNRLNRNIMNGFGSEPYAKEELVAEFTSAILCNYTEVGNKVSERNSVAYIKNWSNAIKNDPKMFTVACYAADKAARMIIGGKLEKVA
jgi:antirestriction protein ArdC